MESSTEGVLPSFRALEEVFTVRGTVLCSVVPYAVSNITCIYEALSGIHLQTSLKAAEEQSQFVQRSVAEESHHLPTAMQCPLLTTGSGYPQVSPPTLKWQSSGSGAHVKQLSQTNTETWICVAKSLSARADLPELMYRTLKRDEIQH